MICLQNEISAGWFWVSRTNCIASSDVMDLATVVIYFASVIHTASVDSMVVSVSNRDGGSSVHMALVVKSFSIGAARARKLSSVDCLSSWRGGKQVGHSPVCKPRDVVLTDKMSENSKIWRISVQSSTTFESPSGASVHGSSSCGWYHIADQRRVLGSVTSLCD